MNKLMKRFSAVGTIVLPLTLIAGLWGMNVEGGPSVPTIIFFSSLSLSLFIIIIILVVQLLLFAPHIPFLTNGILISL